MHTDWSKWRKTQIIFALRKMLAYRCKIMLHPSSPLFTAEVQLDNKYYTDKIYRFMHYMIYSSVSKKNLLIYILLYAFTFAKYKGLEDEEEY
jgi:hypothetical protein